MTGVQTCALPISKIDKYEEYFIKRSLDLTNPGGVVAMIVPSSFLRTHQTYAKTFISAMGELVEAFRLPNGSFTTTDIGTDIVVIKKKTGTPITNFLDDNYFKENPDHILGSEKERKGKFGMEKYVEGTLDEALNKFEQIKNEDKAEKIVSKQEPNLKGEEKVDAVINVQNELEEVEDIKTYEQTHKKPINEPLPQEEEPARPRTTTGKKQVNKKVVKLSPKKTGKVLDLSEYADNTPQEKEFWNNITATGELSGNFNKILANYHNGKYYNDFNYYQGNIYEKLDQLEKNKTSLSESQYKRQRNGLLEVLPERQTVDRMIIAPNTSFVHQTKIDYPFERNEWVDGDWKEIKGIEKMTIAEAFTNWLEDLPQETFGGSSRWEVKGYIDGEVVRGGNQAYNQKVRVRRREVGDKLFKLFLKDGLDTKQKAFFEDQYNRKFNAYYRPDYRQVPLVSKVHDTFKSNPLEIKEVQLQGIGFLINKGLGILAHDVGVGKTMQAIIGINEVLKRDRKSVV